MSEELSREHGINVRASSGFMPWERNPLYRESP